MFGTELLLKVHFPILDNAKKKKKDNVEETKDKT